MKLIEHTFNPNDVEILLAQIEPEYLSEQERQARIEQGQHFNEVLSKEAPPSEANLQLFRKQVFRFGDDMAALVVDLAHKVVQVQREPVLVSLVRAGTPTGVLVKHALALMGVNAPHFSVSIVQGRGFDEQAIKLILERGYRPEQLIFIDGWTGKGVVRRELSHALTKLEGTYGEFTNQLFVLSDIAGVAEHASTRDDVLIPSALLSGPLCGLVSRTLYRPGTELHAAARLNYMEDIDVSRWFIYDMIPRIEAVLETRKGLSTPDADEEKGVVLADIIDAIDAQNAMRKFLDMIMKQYVLVSTNQIKPGVGESSRLFLRKKPLRLIIRNDQDASVQHLIEHARDKGVDIDVRADMPYRACTLMS